MPVNTSPLLRDDLEYDEDDPDPRLAWGFRSMSLHSEEYEDHEPADDRRPFAGSPDPGPSRRRAKQRHSDTSLANAHPFRYQTVADGDAFRLVVLLPGAGSAVIQCQLIWENSRHQKYYDHGQTWHPRRSYRCLSYSWGTPSRDAAILCDGYRFDVTENLHAALRSLRRPTTNILIWIDQICINQEDIHERAHQVSIMKHIFSQAEKVVVWLGEADDRSEKLFEYAKRMRRGEENNSRLSLHRILPQRRLQDTLQKFLTRSWFSRVWVIPEVALSKYTVVACGRSFISWDALVRLIRDVQLPATIGFDKQADLLGNPHQRIAIITQMIQSQRKGLHHTDIMQLLILAKASKATDLRDMIYAFYGLTLLTTFPDYGVTIERLYAEVASLYVTNIIDIDSYAKWHNLTEDRKTQQLMSILYSAGALHQHLTLPSWIPDWTYAWHLAPIWCKTTSNIVTGSATDTWSAGIRSDYRAGGPERRTFEILHDKYNLHRLRLSVIIFDCVTTISDTTPALSPSASGHTTVTLESPPTISPNLRYGRTSFRTAHGLGGIATPGVEVGDALAILVGGDAPVALRRCPKQHDDDDETFKLLCEVYIECDDVMSGRKLARKWTSVVDVVLS